MTIVRRLARPMLAAMFIQGGIDQFRHPAHKLEKAQPLLGKIAGPLSLPNDPETLVRANGAAMAGAGSMLAIGKLPRLSALVLAATLVPTTYAGHAFWEIQDPEQRRTQRTQFVKNLSLLGGVLLAAVDTEGRPGLAWRTKHVAKEAKRSARRAKKDARMAAKAAKHEAGHKARRATSAVHVG
jgi:uncharacterized membrane protein YphA (DoxX/SURF4 family)